MKKMFVEVREKNMLVEVREETMFEQREEMKKMFRVERSKGCWLN